MRFQSLLLGICACTSSGAAVPDDVVAGYFPGRSADVVFKPVNHKPLDAELILVDQAGLLHRGNEDSLKAHNFADVVARGLGVPPVNSDFTPAFLGGANFFRRPRANLVLSIESLGANTLKAAKLPHFMALTQQTDVSPIKKANLDVLALTDISYPNHPLSLSATLFTGTKPYQHGIVAPEWQSSSGSKKIAYKGTASALSANVADIVSQSFGGKSLIVSFSGDEQHAAASCLHPKLLASNQNHHCLALGDTEEQLFGKRVTLSRDSLIKVLASSGQANVLTALRAFPSDSPASYSVDPRGLVTVSFQDQKGGTQKVVFDLHVDEDRKFFSELQGVHSIGMSIGSQDAEAFIQDNVPDLYSVTLTGYTALIEKYGRASTEAAAALHMLDNAVPMFVEHFSSHYPGRFFSQIVLMGSHSSTTAVDKRALFAKCQELVPGNNVASTFPSMFLAGENKNHVCTSISMALSKEFAFQAFCPSVSLVTPSFNAQTHARFLQQRNLRAGAPSPAKLTATPTTTYTHDEVATYQIVLWLSILMTFALFFAVIALCCMDFKKDPLLYSTYNPKWENRKNK
eukprot:CAMPEP_0175131504 /NCGR_PEP_ID=MMETSP0087-20121206/6579_1 /TAXON_ID=136419 /ORGANISM="Unknown Unknown, Strain D1" /LENGTH=571 /DNA_ID=CAMNT_0016413801 /DNA_START=24 /DNA_END=1739 /DNA_ORIENTATION=+